jgi:hypothetical protein
MVLTIVALHTFAVIAAAMLWRSRIGTWIAFGFVLVAAFALGNPRYGVVDAIGAIAGLAIGLHMLPTARPCASQERPAATETGMPLARHSEPPLRASEAAVAAIFAIAFIATIWSVWSHW